MLNVANIKKPGEDVIATLEDMLAAAKMGKLHGFVGVSQDDVGAAVYHLAGIKHRFEVIGYLTVVLHNLVRVE